MASTDHHNCVLFDDADQQDDADEGDDAEVRSRQQQGQNCADARRGQRGKNGQRVDQALVQNAEHDVNGNQRGEDEIGFVAERILKGLRGTLECPMDGTGHAHVALDFFKRGDRVAEGHVGRQVKCERDGGILALVVYLERGALRVIMRNRRERNHGAACR